jgi:small subunit ribosomal protein S18
MARDRENNSKRGLKDDRKMPNPKACPFCRSASKGNVKIIDYKDVNLLRKFISDRGKIRARRVTGNCTQHQRDVAMAVKNAREMALLPYTAMSR